MWALPRISLRHLFIGLFTLTQIYSSTLRAEEPPIEVYSQHGIQETDETVQGLFYEMWLTLSDGGPSSQIASVPLLRKEYLFRTHPGTCMYPANARHIADGDELIQSHIVTKMNLRAYTNIGREKIHSLDDFKDKKLVVPFAQPFKQRLRDFSSVDPDSLILIEVRSAKKRSTMLLAGRVDAMLNVSPLADFTLNKRGGAINYYDPAFIVEELPLTLICHASDRNQKLIDTVNANFLAMEESGAMQALYAKHGLNHDDFHVPPERTDGFIHYTMDPEKSRAIQALGQDHRWAQDAKKADENQNASPPQ